MNIRYITIFEVSLILIAISGLILFVAGYTTDNKILISIGGTCFGTFTAIIYGRFVNSDLLKENKKIQNETLNLVKNAFNYTFELVKNNYNDTLEVVINNFNELSESEKTLTALRCFWYSYHVTCIDSKWVWRCCEYDFEKVLLSNSLFAEVATKNPKSSQKEDEYYTVLGKIVGNSLLLTITPKRGNENPSIVIYPHCGMGALEKYYGIKYLQTFHNKQEAISPVIFSKEKLHKTVECGTIDDYSAKNLDEEWKTNFPTLIKVLPQICEL